jgi:hypothetical protein
MGIHKIIAESVLEIINKQDPDYDIEEDVFF